MWCTCDPICWWICYYWHQSWQQGYVPRVFEMAEGKEPFKRRSDNAPQRRVLLSLLVCTLNRLERKLSPYLWPLDLMIFIVKWTRTSSFTYRYIKEGSTVSVMGVVQRNDNVLMIVAPSEPISTGCQWAKCVLPTNIEGLVLRCEDTSNIDVIPV